MRDINEIITRNALRFFEESRRAGADKGRDVGLATIATAIDCQTSCWAWCATIFSVMAVGATADLGPARAAGF